MRKVHAALGSVVFFALAPGVVAGLVPWWLTSWKAAARPAWWLPLRAAGAVLLLAGTGVLVHAFARFVVEGLGTPAPLAPTRELVVGGLYRYVRNPMYLAVLAAIVGQALLLGARERTEAQFRRLLAGAGFEVRRVVPTRSPAGLSVIEAVPASTRR